VLIEAAVRRCMHGRRDMNDDFSKAASVFRIEDAAATNISGYSYDSVKVDTDTVMTDTNGAKIPQWLLRAYLRDLRVDDLITMALSSSRADPPVVEGSVHAQES